MANLFLVLEYEFMNFVRSFKRIASWEIVVAIVMLILVIKKLNDLVIIFVFIEIFLVLINDYKSEEFKRYMRDKQGIPRKSQIKEWKAQAKETNNIN